MNAAVKCIGKPCAGEPHARFDEGVEETWTLVLSGPLTRLRSTLPVHAVHGSVNTGTVQAVLQIRKPGTKDEKDGM